MRKYYEDYEEDNFNEDYERGYRIGRRDALAEVFHEANNNEFVDELVRDFQDFTKYGYSIKTIKNEVLLSTDYLRIKVEFTNSFLTMNISTSHNISKKGIKSPKTPEEFTDFGKQLSVINKIYSSCKKVAKDAKLQMHFTSL